MLLLGFFLIANDLALLEIRVAAFCRLATRGTALRFHGLSQSGRRLRTHGPEPQQTNRNALATGMTCLWQIRTARGLGAVKLQPVRFRRRGRILRQLRS